jgi:hypothetical protein
VARYTFFTQAARDSSTVATSSEELTNCYPEIAPGDGRTRLNIRSVLGETAFTDGGYVQIRAAHEVQGVLYFVADSSLYSCTSAGTIVEIGAVTFGPDATVRGNGTYVTVAANGSYYVWDGTTLSEPGSGAFASVGSVEFSSYDTILTEQDGRRFEWTAIADPTSRNALYFATAEQRDGNLLRAIVDRAQLFLFGEKSIEVWRNTGASGANRYAYITVIDQGLKSYHLVTRSEAGIFFIGNDNVAYLTSGTGISTVSTPAVNTDLQDGTPIACGYYEDRGHKFFVVTFSDRAAWVYDVSTQVWHRRSSGVDFGAWTARRIVEAFGGWYTLENGGLIRQLTRSGTDVDTPLRRTIRGKPIDMEGRKFSVSEFEFLAAVGTTDLGREAQAMLRVSWDGGLTWSEEMTETLGDLGDYGTQCKFFALGRGEQFTPEISITDEADIVMYSDARVSIT